MSKTVEGVLGFDDVPYGIVARALPLSLCFADAAGDDCTFTPAISSEMATMKWVGEAANNSTKTFRLYAPIGLLLSELNYVRAAKQTGTVAAESDDDADFTVKVKARLTGGAGTVSATLDATCNRLNGEGGVDTGIGVSGDLQETAAQNLNTAEPAWTWYAFVVSGEHARGDDLWMVLKGVIDDTGGSGDKAIEIGAIRVEANSRGNLAA